MIEVWWFPLVAIILITFALTGIISAVVILVSPSVRRLIGGLLIITLVAATLFSYAYAVLTPLPVDPGAEYDQYECLGPPYDTCG